MDRYLNTSLDIHGLVSYFVDRRKWEQGGPPALADSTVIMLARTRNYSWAMEPQFDDLIGLLDDLLRLEKEYREILRSIQDPTTFSKYLDDHQKLKEKFKERADVYTNYAVAYKLLEAPYPNLFIPENWLRR